MKKILPIAALLLSVLCASAQNYGNLVDKTIAIVGGEFISLSEVESEVQMARAQGGASDKSMRCEILEQMLQTRLLLTQAKIDSLTINQEMVNYQLSDRINQMTFAFGGEAAVEEYFGKSLSRLRQDWRRQMEEMSLVQQEQQQIASNIPEVTPFDVKSYLDTVDVRNLPEVPIKYQMSQICVYPDREAAALACKERLLELRERIIAGERFSKLARLYSQDPGSARKGGELGMASRSMFWPAFSDAAMALKPGMISQIVETPDGFHIIEVIEKKGDNFNARHILLQPEYTSEDREKGFARLDSLKALIDSSKITFEQAARYFSQDPASRTNGGQMANPATGSSYFEIDQLKPQDYAALKNLKPGEMSAPIESLDNEGRNGNTVYKIIRLDRILPAHVATIENDYDAIFDEVHNNKQNTAVQEFIEKKIKETHIVLDPLFKDCDFSSPSWKEKFRD